MQASVKQDRQKWLGGSDIPIIMGISPFTTRFDLLLFKAGLQDNEFNGNEYTEYGNIMESKIRDYINEKYGTKFEETKHEYKESGVRCHLDGENKDTVLEIKTTSQVHEDVNDYKVYLVQLIFYMLNVGKEKGLLAVYERPEDMDQEFKEERLQIFYIELSDYTNLVDEIIKAVDSFNVDLEKVKANPLISEEELLPVDIQEISNKIVELENQLTYYKELEAQCKEMKKILYEQMEKNGIKKWKTNSGVQFTLVPSTPDTTEIVFNEEKFKEEQPVVYASYSEEKTKKGKAGYVRITLK